MTDIKTGLNDQQVEESREQFGKNILGEVKETPFIIKLLHILSEPMFILLLVAATIYFLTGENRDGFVMLAFVIGMISIEVVQEIKTDNTLKALKDLSAPTATVVRNGQQVTIASSDIVQGDILRIEEGVKMPADGWVLAASDLLIDESTLTGESLAVTKVAKTDTPQFLEGSDHWRLDYVYAGTLVLQGWSSIEVAAVGKVTEYGKIGIEIAEAPDRPTPLQKQTAKLVKICAGIAGGMFVLVGILTYFNLAELSGSERAIEAILGGITIAMSLLPAEFPVILTVFLSMGASRLAKRSSLVRRLTSVETLGAVSVLCSDKTGTITKNQMEVVSVLTDDDDVEHEVIRHMGLACEPDAYDPMEHAMLDFCRDQGCEPDDFFAGDLVHEYSFTNETKMMGHVWKHGETITVSAKGSPERIFGLCTDIDAQRLIQVNKQQAEMASKGLRVIAVANQQIATEADIPQEMSDCKLNLLGLIGLADPPREGVAEDIALCQKAGIRVIMITGDNGETATAIAKQVGLYHAAAVITGDEISSMSEQQLCEAVKDVSIFSRVIPEHKMRIIRALQANGEVVAMTGDGVNDAPALKNADIGIAMGMRGSEVAREAADLILLDDNFSTIVETVKNGRRIYDNIKKAVGYVFAVHVPMAAATFFGPLLKIAPASLMILPLHVLLFELVVDPTCSVVLERQPAEPDIMDKPPRDPDASILTKQTLIKALIQGAAIAAVSFCSYYYALTVNGWSAPVARTIGFGIMLVADIVLVFVNSSATDSMFASAKKMYKDGVIWTAVLGTAAMLGLVMYSPLSDFFKLAALDSIQLAYMVGAGIVSVAWYEVVKLVGNMRRKQD